MANRQTTRRILFGTAVLIFFIFVLFIRPQDPPSPAIRAPGHLNKAHPHTTAKDGILKGEIVMPELGNATAKAELGRATWKYLHTMLARYPEEPSEEQQETLRIFIYLFARLYPCGECASHFQQHLEQYPPQVSSRNAAAGWGCFIHNEVNLMLEKPPFDCNNIGDFYDCGCEDHKASNSEKGNLGIGRLTDQSEDYDDDEDDEDYDEGNTGPRVEIAREPTTQG